jgi:hypothetical protein
MGSPPISSTEILIPQATRTRPPPRKPRIPLSRSNRTPTSIRLIILPIILLKIILLLPCYSRPITSSRARRRRVMITRPTAPTWRLLKASSASILLRENFLLLFLASFFGCFLAFLLGFLFFFFLFFFGLFFGGFLGNLYSVIADLFVVIWNS